MKVVLFCGGFGLRLRDYSDEVPKPMVRIGDRPILWYLMKYYAHYGITDFILCLGYRGDAIREYFLKYNECMYNDFVMNGGGGIIKPIKSDIKDWKITFVDTGLTANIGQRLYAVRKYLEGEEVFMANYSDALTDLPLDKYIEFYRQQNKTAAFVSVHPNESFHVVDSKQDGSVTNIQPVARSVRINCGFFILKKEFFNYINDGEELVVEPFHRLIANDALVTYAYDGFWKCMDTFKDKREFEEMHVRGERPWVAWK